MCTEVLTVSKVWAEINEPLLMAKQLPWHPLQRLSWQHLFNAAQFSMEERPCSSQAVRLRASWQPLISVAPPVTGPANIGCWSQPCYRRSGLIGPASWSALVAGLRRTSQDRKGSVPWNMLPLTGTRRDHRGRSPHRPPVHSDSRAEPVRKRRAGRRRNTSVLRVPVLR